MSVFLKDGGVYDDSAYRVLTRIAKGQDPMAATRRRRARELVRGHDRLRTEIAFPAL